MDDYWAEILKAKSKANVAGQVRHSQLKKKAKKEVAEHGKPKPRRRAESAKTYKAYIQSAQWRRKKEQAHKHYGGRCTACGSTYQLSVHHRHYRTMGRERMIDLDLLCSGCHANHHESDGKAIDPVTQRFLEIAANF